MGKQNNGTKEEMVKRMREQQSTSEMNDQKYLDHKQKIRKLIALGEKATADNWYFCFGPDVDIESSFVWSGDSVICRIENQNSKRPLTEEDRANGEFIKAAANSRQALSYLLTEVEELRKMLFEEIRKPRTRQGFDDCF